MGQRVWTPTGEQIRSANVTRLMHSCGFEVDPKDVPATEALTRAFVRKTQRDVSWFWERALTDIGVEWQRPYDTVLDLEKGPPFADWFVGGRTNIALNCVDRNAGGPLANQVALCAETEAGEVREFTYAELSVEVNRLAALLKERGVAIGDRVAGVVPMIAESVFAMLATHKIGAVYVPIFSGYAVPAVHERLLDCGACVVITADVAFRRGRVSHLKQELDAALAGLPALHTVVVVQRGGQAGSAPMTAGRDLFLHEYEATGPAPETESMPSMAPALMLFTSGTTGKPKATIHSHAGCLAQMGKELCYNFDLTGDDTFFWLTDMGWMMGPWSVIGVLMHGARLVILEGVPDYPNGNRLWDLVERHGITIFGLSPTAIRLLIRVGEGVPAAEKLSTLRILGSTGEPWDDESYAWYCDHVGQGHCPVINISGGTDLVGSLLAPLPVMPILSKSLQSPGLGMDVDVFDEEGEPVVGEVGYLVCKKPAPSMTRGLWQDTGKYLKTYWSRFPGVWYHGDWARVDADGQWYVLGRADDTMKVAGRRVGPGEIEAALIAHRAVSEAAAVGVPDELKGTQIVCFVVLHSGVSESEELRAELVDAVVQALGSVDRPGQLHFVDDLPKTRSAKILRRLIARAYQGEAVGDVDSLENPQALAAISHAR